MAQIVTDSSVRAGWTETDRNHNLAPGWWIIPMALLGALFWGGLLMWLL